MHLLILFLPASFTEQSSLIWTLPHPFSKLCCKGYLWYSCYLIQGICHNPHLTDLFSTLLKFSLLTLASMMPHSLCFYLIYLPIASLSPFPITKAWAPPCSFCSGPHFFGISLSSLCKQLILYHGFHNHLKANDSKFRPMVQISELPKYR